MRISRLFLVLVALSSPATAQVVVQAASATLQPQISRDDTGYLSCGVRAVVLDVKPDIVDAHDFSINVRATAFAGVLKAGKSQISTADMLKGKRPSKAVIPAPVKFWIVKESEGKALMPQKVIAAETPGFILEGAEVVQTYEVILAIVRGERMQFATRYKNESIDTVISFAGVLQPEEVKPLLACLDGVVERMRTAGEAAK